MAQARRSGGQKRRPRAGEVRTRSGCWKCRERRVKCPEQRPICQHCKRLGFSCAYDVRLTWQVISVPRAEPPRERPLPPVEEWMFLNTVNDDFAETAGLINEIFWDEISSNDTQSIASTTSGPNDCVTSSSSPVTTISMPSPTWNGSSPVITPSLQPLCMSQGDAYLWEHFFVGITPRLAVYDRLNPYRIAVMRMAASSPEGPLFQCIIGASAIQLCKLGSKEMRKKIWQCRANALSLLRKTMQDRGSTAFDLRGNPTLTGQIVGSVVMLCFSEILQDCPDSWTSHVDFALSFLQGKDGEIGALEPVLRDLVQFSTAYFISHRVFAATASPRQFARTLIPTNYSHRLSPMRTLTGCPDRVLALVSDITELAYDKDVLGATAEFSDRRDWIERQLHKIKQLPSCSLLDPADREIEEVAELKRLTALLYFYSRIDGAGPHDPRITRLTVQIMPLLRGTSLRTHTVLWSLFIVATLGVRPENDEERRVVIERLAALQRTRELGNVRKARQIIEDVWRRRDLKASCAAQGWSILPDKYGTVSLV